MSKVKFRPSPLHGHGAYLVSLDGEEIGSVIKRVQSYNIAPRGLTVTTWVVRALVSGQAYDVPMDRHCSTRKEATEALVRAYFRSRKWIDVPPAPGGHEGVWKCLSDFCGAYVREDIPSLPTYRRDAHDDAFHAEEVAA